MPKTLILTEKPNVAKTIAAVLGAKREDGYFEGVDYVITYAFGHLLTLYDCKDYNPAMAKWDLANFPFIPEEFKYKVIVNSKTKSADSGARAQLAIIKKLAERKDIDRIINGGDSDREGETIASMILAYIGTQKPIFRLWLNEHTPDEIKQGLANLRPDAAMRPLKDAGYSRQLTDWVFGINFTTAATLALGQGDMVKCGRVINPVTKLIYDRDMEIENFRPESYCELLATFRSSGGTYQGRLLNEKKETRFPAGQELKDIAQAIAQEQGIIQEKEVKKGTQYAPKLFNLTDLQGYISGKYAGINASKVDKLVQSLYEKQFITYPRTNSAYLDESLKDKVGKVLEIHRKGLPYESKIQYHTSKRVFDNAKVQGHSAIIPTYMVASGLTSEETLVYNEIKKRFIAQFMPPMEFETTEIITRVQAIGKDHDFITRGKTILSSGWQEAYGRVAEPEDKDSDDNEDQLLPNVARGDQVTVEETELREKQTQPPKHYTEKTLLKAMQTCGKKVSEDDLDTVLKGYEIGTPATRSEVIKKIQDIQYVTSSGKNLLITPTGKRFVEIFPVRELMETDFTGRIEKILKDMEAGGYDKEKFLTEIYAKTREGVEMIKRTKGSIGSGQGHSSRADGTPSGKSGSSAASFGLCPVCGKPIVEYPKSFGCSGYREGCKFALWKNDRFLENFKKNLTPTMVKAVLAKNKVNVKGLTSPKTGGKFDAELEYIKNDKGYWGWNIIPDSTSPQKSAASAASEKAPKSIGQCPACGSPVEERPRSYSCAKEGCDFVLWKEDRFLEKFKKKMSEPLAREILKTGGCHLDMMYSARTGKTFSANLTYGKKDNYWGFNITDFGKAVNETVES